MHNWFWEVMRSISVHSQYKDAWPLQQQYESVWESKHTHTEHKYTATRAPQWANIVLLAEKKIRVNVRTACTN